MNRLARVREATLKLGREKQIGLAVLGGLSFILVAVIVWRLRRPDAADHPEPNTVVEQKAPAVTSPDVNKPTVVQQGGHEGAAARLGGFTGRIDTVPPSDPINAVDDPATSARRHVAADDRPGDYPPRVAERTKPTDDVRANPLRGRGQDELPEAPAVVASDGADPDALPPRRPLRRPVDDDLEAPPRRSVYDRAERATTSDAKDSPPDATVSDASDNAPRGNLLRRRVAAEPPVERKMPPRGAATTDEDPPARAPNTVTRTAAPTREPAELAETPPRRTASAGRPAEERTAPVRSASAAVPASQQPSAATRTYLVHEGDTIYDIAQFELGRSARWVEIVALNRAALGEEIHFLKPGMKLVLPGDAAADQVARQTGDDSVR
jgi:hypothetical protein